MKGKAIFLLALFMLGIVAGCGPAEKAGEPLGEKPRELGNAPDFRLQDINGKSFKLSDYAGKVIILNFFATWCPPCRTEMPDFNEIQKEYKNDVKIIAVAVGREDVAKVKSFAAGKGLVFTIAVDSGTAAKAYGPISAIPVTVIIDKKFNTAKKYVGRREKAVFAKDIERLR